MNDSELKLLVAEAIDLDRTISKEAERLTGLRARLIAEAKERKSEQTDTPGGGWSVEFKDAAGQVARVTKPGDKLKGVISPLTADGIALLKLAGEERRQIFNRSIVYLPVENFRLRLIALFKEETVKRILRLCTTKSSPTVSFETKEAS